jgi:hypothetical protein
MQDLNVIRGSAGRTNRPGGGSFGRRLVVLVALVVAMTAAWGTVAGAKVKIINGHSYGVLPPPVRAGGAPVHTNAGPQPPVTYRGGPVMLSSKIFLIFWGPSGSFAPSYSGPIIQWAQDLQADAAKTTNEFSVNQLYSQGTQSPQFITNNVSFGGDLFDTTTYPTLDTTHGCTVAQSPCVTDQQIRAEIVKDIVSQGWPTDPVSAPVDQFLFFTPNGTNSCVQTGECTFSGNNGFCAYHSQIAGIAPSSTVATYSNLPYLSGCDSGQAPAGTDGNPDTDGTLDSAIHEVTESATDPVGNAWFDTDGNEIADKCSFPVVSSQVDIYGAVLGGNLGALTGFNQVIGTHTYYTQQIWAQSGTQTPSSSTPAGCVQRIGPSPSFSAPSTAAAGQAANFDGSGSTDIKDPITTYAWSFGDGTAVDTTSGAHTTHIYAATGTYQVSLTVSDVTGAANATTQAVPITITPLQAGPYSPLTPVRICDTRAGNPSVLNAPANQCNGAGNTGTTIPAGGTKSISVAGSFGVPSNATAVVLNVTAVNPTAGGFLTIFPTGAARPVTSNLNYSAGEAVPNLVEVGTGAGGNVSIFSQAQTDVVVDLEGYVSATAIGGTGAGLYTPLSTPARLCDTRAGNPSGLVGDDAQCNGAANAGHRLAANATLNVKVATNNGIPAGATAAVLNVTDINPTSAGFLTVFPQGASKPFTANVNFAAGQVSGNRVIVPLSTSDPTPGDISIFSSAAADVVVDVSGYYSASGGAGNRFTAEVAPVRICDTRPNNPSGLGVGANQCNDKPLGPGSTEIVNVSGLAGVPVGAKAVVVNLTAIVPTVGTFLTVYPGGTRPLVSDLNPAAGDVKGNLTVATLNANGTVTIFNSAGNVDMVVDVLGWYS